ncbi:ExbD/TolR family protein [Falsihalocynthiibacter sp. BN13B15]|uniref:ExbD/TolR family protein n=1 Tax=Falsihalocynthiibacter sp. BN13B15 TaxID=3240871 RepID=UPI00350F200F
MKLARRPRRLPPETIIPLIDVVFFLLIFFMLIGRMDATAPFAVYPAFSTTGTEMPGGGATLSIGAQGELALNSAESALDSLLGQLSVSLVDDPNLLVRINAHQDADLAHVLPLMAKIEALGARDLVLVVTPEMP